MMGFLRIRLGNPEDPVGLSARASISDSQAEVHRQLGRAIHRPALVRLVLDSGLRRSVLIPTILHHLSAPQVGTARVQTGVGQQRAVLYEVKIEILAGSLAPLARVVAAGMKMPPKLAGFDGLLGRDVLSQWEVFYSGLRGRVTIRDYTGWLGWLVS